MVVAAAAEDGLAGSGAGLAAVPLIADAKAVTCVRTSVSFVFAVSSSVGVAAVALVGGPSSSDRILSMAATSAAQLDLPRAVVFDAVVLSLPAADFSNALR